MRELRIRLPWVFGPTLILSVPFFTSVLYWLWLWFVEGHGQPNGYLLLGFFIVSPTYLADLPLVIVYVIALSICQALRGGIGLGWLVSLTLVTSAVPLLLLFGASELVPIEPWQICFLVLGGLGFGLGLAWLTRSLLRAGDPPGDNGPVSFIDQLRAAGVLGLNIFCAILPTSIALGFMFLPRDWFAYPMTFSLVAGLLCAMAIVLLLPWMLLSLWLIRRAKRLPAFGHFALAAGSVVMMCAIVELPYVVPRLSKLSELLQRHDAWQQAASYAQMTLTLGGVAGLTAGAMHAFRKQLTMDWML